MAVASPVSALIRLISWSQSRAAFSMSSAVRAAGPALRGIVPGPRPWPARIARGVGCRGGLRHGGLVVVVGALGGPVGVLRRGRLASGPGRELAALVGEAARLAHGPLAASVGDGASGAAWLAPFVASALCRRRRVGLRSDARPAPARLGHDGGARPGAAAPCIAARGARGGARPQGGQHRVDAGRDRHPLCRRPVLRRAGTRGPTVGGVGPVSRKAGSATVPGVGVRTGVRGRRRRPVRCSTAGPGGRPGRRGPGRAATGESVKASSARVAARRRGTASGATVTRTARRGSPCPEDLDECGTGGDAQDQPEGQEDELAPGHAVRNSIRSRSSPSTGGFPPDGQRSCEPGQRQPVTRARERDSRGGAPESPRAGPRFAALTRRMVDSGGRRTADHHVAPRARPPHGKARPAWPSIPPRNSSSSLSTPPGCSATSSARKPARSGRTAAAISTSPPRAGSRRGTSCPANRTRSRRCARTSARHRASGPAGAAISIGRWRSGR